MVTLRGDRHAHNVGVSLLSRIGFICDSLERHPPRAARHAGIGHCNDEKILQGLACGSAGSRAAAAAMAMRWHWPAHHPLERNNANRQKKELGCSEWIGTGNPIDWNYAGEGHTICPETVRSTKQLRTAASTPSGSGSRQPRATFADRWTWTWSWRHAGCGGRGSCASQLREQRSHGQCTAATAAACSGTSHSQQIAHAARAGACGTTAFSDPAVAAKRLMRILIARGLGCKL